MKSNADNNIDRHIAMRLHELRMELKISQATVAKIISVSPQQIQKIESGKNRFSASQLYIVACELKVPITYFFKNLHRS